MLDFNQPEGATPLEDLSGLIPTHITLKSELNQWEAANILEATRKYLTGKKTVQFTLDWFKKLHLDMYGHTWSWAGKFRTTDLNIGVVYGQIQEQVRLLADDISYWGQNAGGMDIVQQSVRIHHRLAFIHPFLNGNGRHARLAADIYLYIHGHSMPEWPSKELIELGTVREKYIAALKSADKGNYKPLEEMTRGLMMPRP